MPLEKTNEGNERRGAFRSLSDFARRRLATDVLFTGFKYGSAQTVTGGSPQTINARKQQSDAETADRTKETQIDTST